MPFNPRADYADTMTVDSSQLSTTRIPVAACQHNRTQHGWHFLRSLDQRAASSTQISPLQKHYPSPPRPTAFIFLVNHLCITLQSPHQSLDSRIASGALPTNLDIATPTSTAPPEVGPGAQGIPSPGQRARSVLDGMAVCEVAWHEGASLPETLYACLYLHPTAFSAVLKGLGWEVPALASVGGVHPKLDLRIKEGEHAGTAPAHFSWRNYCLVLYYRLYRCDQTRVL